MDGLRPLGRDVLPAVVLLASLVAAIGVALLEPSTRWLLVGAIVVVLSVSLVVRGRQLGRLDVVDPIFLFFLAWTTMFVLRPVGSSLVDDWTLRQRYDVGEWIDGALLLALIAEAAYCAAYLSTSRTGLRDVVRGPRPFMPSAAGYIVAAGTAGIGLVATLYSFGSRIESTTAYVQALPVLSIPGALMLIGFSAGRPTLQRFLAYAIVAVALASFAVIGVRTWILPLLGSVIFLWYFQRRARPHLRTVALIGATVLIVFGNLELTRSLAGYDDLSAQELGPAAAVERLITGPSTEMLPALALQIGTEGRDWSYSPGYWVASLLTHWVPSGLWPAKPRSSGEVLYSTFFPDDYAVSKANAQFSVVGEFYFDSGVLGVVVGLAGVGILTALIFAWFRRHETNLWAQISYSMFPWVMIFGLRGDLLQTSALAFFLYGPVAIAVLASPKGRPESEGIGA